MKSLIKFLPVAFGALVMASCSNNDLFETNGSETAEYQLKKGEILVTVGEETSATRASIGEAAKADGDEISLYRSVFWRENDQIKVYDATQWRPQYFKWANNLDGVKDYFKNAAGPVPAVFELDPTLSPKGTDATQYEDGYAVFPGEKWSQFQGEERSLLEFDYSKMRYWSWDAVDTKYFSTSTPDGKSWYTEFPMWGNVKDSKLALKYLTGFLRIDLSGYKEVPAGMTRASLVIQATKQLAGYFAAPNFDYTAKQAPLLYGLAGVPTNYTNLAAIQTENTIADPVSRTATVDNDFTMVINLPIADLKANEGKLIDGDMSKHNVFFVPVPVALTNYVLNAEGFNKFQDNGLPDAGATPDPYDIRVSLVYDALIANAPITINPALYNAGGDVLFEQAGFDEIDKAGRFYNIDCIDAGEVNTPYQLGKLIQNLDKIGRKVTVNLKTAPVVKGNETPQDMNLYVGNLYHDITINFPLGIEKGTGGTDNYHHNATMYITKSGPGKLTLNFNGGIAANYPAICIRDNGTDTGNYSVIQSSKTESEVVLTSENGTAIDLPLVVVETANNVVTLKTGADQVILGKKGGAASKMTIDAKDKTIKKFDAKANNSVLELKNGTITDMLTLYANAFTCNSEGKSFIKTVTTPTSGSENANWEAATPAQWTINAGTPYKDCYNNVTFNSVWDGNYYTGTDFTQQKDIHTAAQFSIGSYVAASALHTNLIIGANEGATAAQKNWYGRTLGVNFDGLGFTANLLTTNAAAGNGLFADATAALTVNDLNIKANIQPSTAVDKIGGLFGTASANVTLYGVNLLEGSKLGFFTTAGNYNLTSGSSVGGLIGELSAVTLTAQNCSVKGEIAGFAALGGYVGYAKSGAILNFGKRDKAANAALYTDVFGNNHAAEPYAIATSEVTFTETRTIPATLFNTGYGTIGMFLGKADISTGAVTMTIEGDRWSAGTAQPVKTNDKIAGNESALLFHKHHILAGYDVNGNEKYNNYKGSTFNVIGAYGNYTGANQPVVNIGDGWYGTVPSYHYILLKNRQQNETNTDVPGIETAYQNWFEPDAE
jgi:hypothetical protein